MSPFLSVRKRGRELGIGNGSILPLKDFSLSSNPIEFRNSNDGMRWDAVSKAGQSKGE